MGEPLCKYHTDRKAHRVLQYGQGAVCEECWQLICVGKDPAPKKHPAIVDSKEVFVEKCWCGRDNGHRGRHIGTNNIRMTPKIDIQIRRKPGAAQQTRFGAVIAQLKAERAKLDEAIAVLEKLS